MPVARLLAASIALASTGAAVAAGYSSSGSCAPTFGPSAEKPAPRPSPPIATGSGCCSCPARRVAGL